MECASINKQTINTVAPKITEKLKEDLKNCADEIKWLLCNVFFSKCIQSTITKKWKYFPVCQESCYSFITTKQTIIMAHKSYTPNLTLYAGVWLAEKLSTGVVIWS